MLEISIIRLKIGAKQIIIKTSFNSKDKKSKKNDIKPLKIVKVIKIETYKNRYKTEIQRRKRVKAFQSFLQKNEASPGL